VNDVRVGGTSPALPATLVRRSVQTVLQGEGRPAQVSVTFLGPVAMRRLNRRHRRHDRPTDVLAFALPLPGGELAGDIYLCRAVAARQARDAGVSEREELVRLVIHGVLHVLGYDHPDTGRERSPMWKKQERYVGKVMGRDGKTEGRKDGKAEGRKTS
jgi:probable rRNA maturation factor